ncbi:Oidioi.mRNA.OKI2018_I69.chr2.g5754.t1.cds [Oikopleura dioica]|uniref:Oidioi.mRNA.OKI2018_I69.chr2.g5754.t1.cds n=1 Tax=Oikopleura dioica TaxID=34765 RepID=A0ABN7T5P4_OIKDI|nr:Oidioi.mRNA.OKI2018_I69.chr2.g5754.t1.cds [Oikopleura dioica]
MHFIFCIFLLSSVKAENSLEFERTIVGPLFSNFTQKNFCQTTECNVVRIKCPLKSTSITWKFRHIVAITRERAPVWVEFEAKKACNHTYLRQCENCREYCFWSPKEIEIQNYYALKDDGLYKCSDGLEEATGHLNFINPKCGSMCVAATTIVLLFSFAIVAGLTFPFIFSKATTNVGTCDNPRRVTNSRDES